MTEDRASAEGEGLHLREIDRLIDAVWNVDGDRKAEVEAIVAVKNYVRAALTCAPAAGVAPSDDFYCLQHIHGTGADPCERQCESCAAETGGKKTVSIAAYLETARELRDVKALVEGLKTTLKPFAAFADHRRKIPADQIITIGSAIAKPQLTMGDCYAALDATTLSSTDEKRHA